jgi:hypothetical protein
MSEENAIPLQCEGASPEPLSIPEKDRTEAMETGEMLAGMGELPEMSEGKVIQGKVLKITDSEVLVDIGQKFLAANSWPRMAHSPSNRVMLSMSRSSATTRMKALSRSLIVRRLIQRLGKRSRTRSATNQILGAALWSGPKAA